MEPSISSLPSPSSQCYYPDGLLRTVYSLTFFPTFMRAKKDGTYRGTFVELWKMVATALNCSRGVTFHFLTDSEMTTVDNDGWGDTDGTLPYVLRGDAFTSMDTSYLSPSRVAAYRHTHVGELASFAFYEGVAPSIQKESSIAFFVEFTPSAAVAFIGLWLAVAVVRRIVDKPRGSVFVEDLLAVYLGVFALSFSLIGDIYSSTFRSSHSLLVDPPSTTFGALIPELHSGTRRWIWRRTDAFADDQRALIAGDHAGITADSSTALFAAICGDFSLVGSLYEDELYDPRIDITCRIRKIQPIPVSSFAHINALSNYGSYDRLYFMLPRNVTKPVIEKINRIILTMFSDDLNNGLWRRRMGGVQDWRGDETKVSQLSFTPIALAHLAPIFLAFLASGAVGGALVFVEHASRAKAIRRARLTSGKHMLIAQLSSISQFSQRSG